MICKKCGVDKEAEKFKNGLKACRSCNKKQEKVNRKLKFLALRDKISQSKITNGCCICGWNKFASALDLHHVDERDKKFSIGEAMCGSPTWSFKAVYEELAKCCVLCSNCHRGIHNGDIEKPQYPPMFSLTTHTHSHYSQ